MRPELERLRLIEHQLLGHAAALPAGEWHLRQLLDGELAADAEVQQQLYQGLQLAGRQQLRQELRQLHHQLYPPPTSGWLGWLRRLWMS